MFRGRGGESAADGGKSSAFTGLLDAVPRAPVGSTGAVTSLPGGSDQSFWRHAKQIGQAAASAVASTAKVAGAAVHAHWSGPSVEALRSTRHRGGRRSFLLRLHRRKEATRLDKPGLTARSPSMSKPYRRSGVAFKEMQRSLARSSASAGRLFACVNNLQHQVADLKSENESLKRKNELVIAELESAKKQAQDSTRKAQTAPDSSMTRSMLQRTYVDGFGVRRYNSPQFGDLAPQDIVAPEDIEKRHFGEIAGTAAGVATLVACAALPPMAPLAVFGVTAGGAALGTGVGRTAHTGVVNVRKGARRVAAALARSGDKTPRVPLPNNDVVPQGLVDAVARPTIAPAKKTQALNATRCGDPEVTKELATIVGVRHLGRRVTIEAGPCAGKMGTIRFDGTVVGRGMVKHFGIELDSASGKHNGTWGGVTYFRAHPRRGIFVPATDVTLHSVETI